MKSTFMSLSGPSGLITSSSLSKFFKRNGFYSTPALICSIIRRLDVDYDECLNFEELSKALVLFEIDKQLVRKEDLEA